MAKHEDHLGHLLWELSARVAAIGEDQLTAIGLSRSSLGMLDIVATSPGIGIAEIARRVPKTQQAVSQVVARLETLGLLERRLIGPRAIGLFLTAAGTKQRDAGAAAELAAERELEAALGRGRYDRLRAALIDVRPVLVAAQERRADGEATVAPRSPRVATRSRKRRPAG